MMLVAASPMKKNMEVPLPRGVDWPERIDHGQFTAMMRNGELPFKQATARRLMAIARDRRIRKREFAPALPPSGEYQS